MEKPVFQAVEVAFKDAESGEQYTAVAFCSAFLKPEEFERIFNSDTPVSSGMLPTKVSRPMTMEDLGAFPEFEQFMESLTQAVGER
jgi:hypothetical protein